MASKKRSRGSDAAVGKKKKTAKTPRARKIRDEDEVPSSERRRSGRAHKAANYAESDEDNEGDEDVEMEDAEPGAEADEETEPDEPEEEEQVEEKDPTPPPVTKASKVKAKANGIAAPVSPKVAKAKALAKKASASPLGKRSSGRGARGKKKERDIMSIPSDSD